VRHEVVQLGVVLRAVKEALRWSAKQLRNLHREPAARRGLEQVAAGEQLAQSDPERPHVDPKAEGGAEDDLRSSVPQRLDVERVVVRL